MADGDLPPEQLALTFVSLVRQVAAAATPNLAAIHRNGVEDAFAARSSVPEPELI
jgi:hypothetical protein